MNVALVLPLLAAVAVPPPVGRFHASLIPTPGQEVGFEIRVSRKGPGLSATLINGSHEAPFTSAAWDGTNLTLALAHFDASIVARPVPGGLEGIYERTTATGRVEVPLRASRSAPKVPALAAGAPSLTGDWAVEIGGAGSLEKTHGVFTQKGSALSGTLLTTTGDYGPLHGTFDGAALVLTVFDGVHVYRFTGAPQPDGTLLGEFRSRTNPPVPWTGRRLTAAEAAAYLPDGFSVVRPKNPTEPYRFSFPDSSGNVVSSTDPRFAGKPVLVAFMGTWCPNCNDEAPVLKELYATYRARGLEVVSLAFEYTDDVERSRRQVKRFLSRYGIEHPVLIAGTTKSAPSSEAMTQLDGWQGYPTTLFLDRSHKVVKIHSGFDGPATGARFAALKKEMAEAVEGLLR